MVRGRRARTLVATVKDDNCSPVPKTKRQRISKLTTKISNKTHSITEFFQAVDEAKIILEGDLDPQEIVQIDGCQIYSDEILDKEDEFSNFPKTPLFDGKKKIMCIDITSPPTPHRIELHTECLEDDKDSDNALVLEKPLKAKRKLDNNMKNCYKDNRSHKLTEYFPVRRSVRKTKSTVLEEKQRTLEQALRKNLEEGLEVKVFEGKGRGVVAAKHFSRGDFVVEYSGDLIDTNEAKRREEKYSQNENTGCYMYYFKHNNQQYCIDATAETGRLGRLVNHSRNGNLVTRTVMVDNKPRLVLIAKDEINIGEEVNYDYGDRSKESLKHHPWLAY